MPNRILRDWTDSETIEKLTVEAEVFFTRLIMKVDDFGRYSANPKLLKSTLFPLKEYSQEKITTWMKECEEVGLIQTYNSNDRNYLVIHGFKQHKRKMISDYPDPPSSASAMQTTIECPPETKRKETDTESEKKNESHVETWLKDLPNSSHLERISALIGIKKEILISRIPDFRKKVELSYPSQDKFLNHFKNWILKEHKEVEQSSKTTVSFGNKKR